MTFDEFEKRSEGLKPRVDICHTDDGIRFRLWAEYYNLGLVDSIATAEKRLDEFVMCVEGDRKVIEICGVYKLEGLPIDYTVSVYEDMSEVDKASIAGNEFDPYDLGTHCVEHFIYRDEHNQECKGRREAFKSIAELIIESLDVQYKHPQEDLGTWNATNLGIERR